MSKHHHEHSHSHGCQCTAASCCCHQAGEAQGEGHGGQEQGVHDFASCGCGHDSTSGAESPPDEPEPSTEGCHEQDASCHCGHPHSHTHEDGCDCGHSHDEAISAPYAKPLLLTGLLLAGVSLLPWLGALAPWLMAAATLLIGYPLFLAGITGIFSGRAFDELGLLTIAVAASLGLASQSADPFEGMVEALAVTVFFRMGNALEARAVAKSKRDIEALTNIRPNTARLLLADQTEQTVLAATVQLGSTILLKAGDRVPIDCELLSGGGFLDLSAITGEPIPVAALPGVRIPSGAINTDGLLTCKTVATFEDSAASRIIRMVRDSAEQKGAAERFITRFSKVYTPAVVLIAALLACLPPLFGFGSFSVWISRALVFLVASCPCALVISVPLTFFAGVGAASRAGVLIKGTRYLEALAKADCIAFDKTGTLTAGKPMVSALHLFEGFSREEVLPLAAAAEKSSNHPAARAVLDYAGEPSHEEISHFIEHPGMGVSLTVGNKHLLCGSARLLTQQGIDCSSLPFSNVLLAVDGRAACGFVLADAPRPEAKTAIAALRKLGIKTIAMVTGDAAAPAGEVASALSIDTVYAGLLPEDKAAQIKALKETHRSTIFVGDGINDAPVLALADVGIAMGLGTDTAIEAADLVLVQERLTALPNAVLLARKTVQKARQNIIFALVVKGLVLLLGAMGLASMWMAVFADVGVSILAILNALTLLRHKS